MIRSAFRMPHNDVARAGCNEHLGRDVTSMCTTGRHMAVLATDLNGGALAGHLSDEQCRWANDYFDAWAWVRGHQRTDFAKGF